MSFTEMAFSFTKSQGKIIRIAGKGLLISR